MLEFIGQIRRCFINLKEIRTMGTSITVPQQYQHHQLHKKYVKRRVKPYHSDQNSDRFSRVLTNVMEDEERQHSMSCRESTVTTYRIDKEISLENIEVQCMNEQAPEKEVCTVAQPKKGIEGLKENKSRPKTISSQYSSLPVHSKMDNMTSCQQMISPVRPKRLLEPLSTNHTHNLPLDSNRKQQEGKQNSLSAKIVKKRLKDVFQEELVMLA